MSSEADIRFHATSEFGAFPPKIEVITCGESAAGVGDFPDAAEVVFRVVVESRVRAAYPLLALREVAFGYGGAVGFAFLGGLVAA
jgi:hypothetical protein